METTTHTCSCPGCVNPGTCWCSACQTTFYCSGKCQTADWPSHKEECEGYLRKQGIALFEKAQGYDRERSYPQALRYADIALIKLNQHKDRPVELTSAVMSIKFDSLNMMGQDKDALECAKEWYCLWLTKHTHPPAITAAFALIESCIHNGEYDDVRLYAHTTWETITLSRDSHIPDSQREEFTARGAHYVAKSIFAMVQSGGIPAEEKHEAGNEAITRARQALDIFSRLHGIERKTVAMAKVMLAQVLDFFKEDGNDESLRLFEDSKAIYTQLQGNSSIKVGEIEEDLGALYYKRAKRALNGTNDLHSTLSYLDLSLLRLREATRIYRSLGQLNKEVDRSTKMTIEIEGLRQVIIEEIAAESES